MPRREKDQPVTTTEPTPTQPAPAQPQPTQPAPTQPQPAQPQPAQPATPAQPGTTGTPAQPATPATPADPNAPVQEPAPKAEKPLGPMTTRTGAEALVIAAPKGQRVFTAGGDKGAKIAELLKTKPEMPRKEIAALVGCSQSRVAEVARVLGISQARSAAAPAAETQPQATNA
jgi:hypothetical protein